MLKQRIICILGLFTVIFPFFGVPFFWKRIVLVFIGLLIFTVGYLLYRERRDYLAKLRNTSQSFVEQRPNVDIAAMYNGAAGSEVSEQVTPTRIRRRRVVRVIEREIPDISEKAESENNQEREVAPHKQYRVSSTYSYQQGVENIHE